MTELAPADPAFVARLHQVLPDAAFRDVTDAYLTEPRGKHQGQAGAVVAPFSTEEVAAVVRACAAARVGIVPWGGGTGLVGGQVKGEGPLPLILSLERLSAIRAVRPEANVLIADAGAILQTVQEAAEAVNRLFPLSLASQGSARIGGLMSTNAGGVGVLRYGNARDLCLGIEAVLPNGDILRGLSGLRKDNTGYDLRHLLIGAEGTLGIITGAALKLSPRPSSVAVAFLQVPSPAAALTLLSRARDLVGDGVSAFELVHRTGFDFLAEVLPDTRTPFDTPPEWSVLIELGLSAASAETALETLLEQAFEAELVSDGVIAQSEAQRQEFWTVREIIPEANKRIGAIASHDISVPLGELAGFIDNGYAAMAAAGPYRVNCFGHVGDGNLHFNIFPPKGGNRADYKEDGPRVTRILHDLVRDHGGSFSAEHGVGRLKVEDLERYGDPAKLTAMRAIKSALDPLGIMNPGAVLRA